MKYKLSVLMPGIRSDNWERLYSSIFESCKYDWELVVISPYDLPDNLKEKTNIQHIKDFGSPIRCQQIGLIQSEGEYITWAADDGVFLKDALSIGIDTLKGKSEKTLVMGKYIEGKDNGDMPMTSDEYYNLKNHDGSRLKNLPNKIYWMLNVGVVPRELLIKVGGWECERFEVCPCSYNDLAIRLQNYGCHFIIQNELMFKCSHMPGTSGDHAPIHYAQTEHDHPKFNKLYNRPDQHKRIFIDINNWKNTLEIWNRRFKDRLL